MLEKAVLKNYNKHYRIGLGILTTCLMILIAILIIGIYTKSDRFTAVFCVCAATFVVVAQILISGVTNNTKAPKFFERQGKDYVIPLEELENNVDKFINAHDYSTFMLEDICREIKRFIKDNNLEKFGDEGLSFYLDKASRDRYNKAITKLFSILLKNKEFRKVAVLFTLSDKIEDIDEKYPLAFVHMENYVDKMNEILDDLYKYDRLVFTDCYFTNGIDAALNEFYMNNIKDGEDADKEAENLLKELNDYLGSSTILNEVDNAFVKATKIYLNK